MRITNLTSLASASSFVAIILDFQNRAVDMTNGDPGDYVPIQVVRLAETGEQQWTFTSIDDDILFSITNVNGVSALSYPSAEVKGASGTIVHQQAMTHTSVETSWILQSGETAFNLLESTSGLALTSWAANPDLGDDSNPGPLTLEELVLGNPAQEFGLDSS